MAHLLSGLCITLLFEFIPPIVQFHKLTKCDFVTYRPTKKRRRSRRITQSLTSMKEVAVPLKNLEDIFLTGELHYRSKLTWTKKMVALINGRLICYKPDKAENRPSFVILLTGYDATFQKREGKRNFEINLTHDNFESHTFLADFKEWAEIWCEVSFNSFLTEDDARSFFGQFRSRSDCKNAALCGNGLMPTALID